MALYRVGNAGATVVGTDGALKGRLAPGDLVVPGVLETPGAVVAYLGREIMPAEPPRQPDGPEEQGDTGGGEDDDREPEGPLSTRRVRRYDDKRARPAEDKDA